MASATPEGGGKGKRPLDVEFNLIPFIDLLSCLISFLLIVAVWTQIAAMDVKHAPTQGGGEPPKEKQVNLTITLTEKAFYLSDGGSSVTLDKKEGAYDFTALEEKLKEIRTALPALETATIQSEDKIPYGEMIKTMDVCRGAGLVGLSVAGVPKG